MTSLFSSPILTDVTPFQRTLLAAQGYFELKMYREAIRELNTLDPKEQLQEEVLETRLQILMKANRWRQAARVGETYCALFPNIASGFIHTAFCLHELGRTRAAKNVLLEGPAALVKEATYHYNLACYECVLGNLEAARAHLETSLSMDQELKTCAREDPDLKPLFP